MGWIPTYLSQRFPDQTTMNNNIMAVYWAGILGSRLMMTFLSGKIKPKQYLIFGNALGGIVMLGSTFLQGTMLLLAFLLLGLIGVNMIRESREASCPLDSSFSPRAMLPLAVATSIDALAVGITFAFLNVKILPAVIFIGTVTFLLSAAGVRVGAVFGARFRSKAELAGGVILILMGLKILLEHLGVLG